MPKEKFNRRELYILTFTEFWDRFTYYGLQALLVLYTTKKLLFTDSQAYELYGTFTALTFATPILGGLLADKIAELSHCIIWGAILIIMGNMFLLLSNQTGMYIGLSALICGIGLLKPNNASLIGLLHKNTSLAHQRAFSIFYMGMNAGALLGPIMYGFLAHHYGWHDGFAVSSLGMLVALILLNKIKNTLSSKTIQANNNPNKKILSKLPINQTIAITILVALALFYLFLHHAQWFGKLLVTVGLITVGSLTFIAIKSDLADRKKIIGLSLLAFFCIFFFACSLQTATTLTLFIERDVNRTIGNIQLPTMIFLSLEPFFIIVSAPWITRMWALVARQWGEPVFSTKIMVGLIFAGISFLLFSYASAHNNIHGHVALVFILLGNLVLGLGELCVLPVALSAISLLAPLAIRSTMMGVLFLSLAFSGYLAGAIANIISLHNTSNNLHASVNYTQAFIDVALVTFVVSIVMLLMNPLLKWMLRGAPPNQNQIFH